ncbi:MAG: ATP-binding protein, partial [Candidatus Sungbacteria bacterium]|nr:ATP-binding protein [Candidatus Sungbacteria bacterium]
MAIISRIAVSGGPRSGKSTVLEAIKEEARDYKAIITPEVATEFFSNGVDIAENGLDNLEFQKHALLYQVERENRYDRLAERIRHPRVVRLSDRGIMGGMAYINPTQFLTLLRKEAGLSVEEAFSRYDAVLHLESSAFLGDEYYIREDNNSVRQEEDPEQVRALDLRTRNSCVGHQRLIIIPASANFDEKKARVNKVLQMILADPHLENERKFEVGMPDFDAIKSKDVRVVPIFIEQIYLRSFDERSRRIRKRGWDGSFTYY